MAAITPKTGLTLVDRTSETEAALPTTNHRSHHDPVARLPALHTAPNLNHLANRLMSDAKPALRNCTVKIVQIASADRTLIDSDDKVFIVNDCRIWNGLVAEIVRGMKKECFQVSPRHPTLSAEFPYFRSWKSQRSGLD
jgi:hypothetical protein